VSPDKSDDSVLTPSLACTEGVQWFIRTQPVALNVDNFNSLKSVVKFNSRYTQNALGDDNLLAVARSAAAVRCRWPPYQS
jgi:carbonic anhydrase